MVFRFLALGMVVAALAGGAWAVKNNVGGVRTKAQEQANGLLDGILGVKKAPERPERPARAPAPRVAAARPARPAIERPVEKPVERAAEKPVEKPAPVAPPPPAYVDRAPAPSALERVKVDDQKRLDDLIARKSPPPRAVAARDDGARRHAH